MKVRRILWRSVLGLSSGCALATSLEVRFVASAPHFQAATVDYRKVWEEDGSRILEALNRYSGVTLPDGRIEVIVFEGESNSGRRGGPVRLRASYPEAVKRATLAHELLHRHLDEIRGIEACYSEVHDLMAVILFEVWSELWGREFAHAQAAVESGRSKRYRASWSKALAMGESHRRAEIAQIGSCRPPNHAFKRTALRAAAGSEPRPRPPS